VPSRRSPVPFFALRSGVRVAVALPTGGLLVGCILGVFWPDAPSALLIALLIASAILAVGALCAARRALFAAALTVSFAAGGTLLAVRQWQDDWRPTLKIAFESIARDERHELQTSGRLVPEEDSASVVVVGVLQSDAAPTSGGAISLNLATRWIGRIRSGGGQIDPAVNPVNGGLLLTVVGALAAEHQHEWRAGRLIRAPAQIHAPSVYLDPGVSDQRRVLARRGIVLVGTVKSGALVDVEARGSPVSETAASIRAFSRQAISSSVARWSAQAAGIVTAIVIGDRSGLDEAVERRLQEAGTYHVIAISGGNIAILVGLTLVIFRMAGLLGRGAMLSAIVGLVAYGYLVGGGASVDRATMMAVVYLTGRALDLRGPPTNALVLVAGILLAIDPLAVVDPAFLLTFGATAAILVVSAEVSMRKLPRLAAAMVGMFVASMAAEAALLPVSATIFSRVTFAGLALNFFAIPLMAVAQIAGMVIVPLYVVSGQLASVVGWFAYVGAEGLVRTADLVSYAPFVTWRVAPPNLLASAAYYAAGLSAWCLWRRRVHISGSGESAATVLTRRGAVLITVLSALWIVAEPWTAMGVSGDGRLHVTFIDVGQGDSALVRFPRGATLLVDAGGLPGSGSFDIGDRVVAPVLRESGVRRLGTIALTHGDADHIGGASSAILEFRPWEVWEGVPVLRSEALQAIHASETVVHSQSRNVQTNDATFVDGVTVIVRHPTPPDWERQDARNDDSIVLELKWRDVSIVLTGDISAEVERAIASQFSPAPLRVIKVPHHGSSTSSSSAFVRALNPRVAVVSVGRSNRFGHPAPTVLRRYEEVHAEVFRTDRDGAVTVDTDGTSLDVHTFAGRRIHLQSTPAYHEDTKGTKGTKTPEL
jgi:competence protein ComEC